MSPKRKLQFALAIAAVFLLFAECVCRLMAPVGGLLQGELEQTEGGQAALMMRGNPFLLWELAPGQREEAGGTVQVNRAGFRDQERGVPKRARALALGDSSVYGFGVSDAELFTTLLEKGLAADVINGGVPGYSSTQALNLLFGRGLALDPDLLIVATLWSDNNFDRFVDENQLDRYAAWQRTETASVQSVLEHSAIYRTLQFSLRQNAPGRVGWMELQRKAPSGFRRVPIATYAKNLAEFCTVMAAREGGVVFVVLPNRHDLEGGKANPPWVPYRQVMRDTATACGAPLVDLPKVFSQRAQPFLFLDEMHPSTVGHQVMAQEIARVLKRAGWPAKRLRAQDPGGPVSVPADPFEGQGIALDLFGG